MKGGTGKSTLALCIASIIGEDKCDIVSLDPQDTLGKASTLTGLFKPVEARATSKPFVIWDTPPYLTKDIEHVYKNASIIIVPCKIGYPDLLAVKSTYAQLEKVGVISKTVLVFNESRLPVKKNDREVISIFSQNYPDLKIAKQIIALRNDFKNVFLRPIEGKALEEIKNLMKEVCIIPS